MTVDAVPDMSRIVVRFLKNREYDKLPFPNACNIDCDCIVQRVLYDAVGRMARGCEEYRAETSLVLDMTIRLMAQVLHISRDRSLISPGSADSKEYTHGGVAH